MRECDYRNILQVSLLIRHFSRFLRSQRYDPRQKTSALSFHRGNTNLSSSLPICQSATAFSFKNIAALGSIPYRRTGELAAIPGPCFSQIHPGLGISQ